jgi:serine/threonine-protein kinase
MSPEQAKGLPVDKRSDIWAFGVVLWEMLTGSRLFAGESTSETLAAVLRDPVPPPDAPVEIRRPFGELIGRCLERNERRRLRDIGEARIALENSLDGGEKAVAEAPPPPARPTRFREGAAWAVAALALVVALSVWWRAWRDPARVESVHFAVTMRTGQSLSLGDQPILALSPDGRKLAYSATDPESGWSMIHLRKLDQLEPVVVPGTEGASHPFFSPDGGSLAFFAEHRLKKVSLEAGGGVITLAEAPNPRGGVWGSDDSILFAPGYDTPLVRIAASDGSGGDVLTPNPAEGERTYRWPELLPGGRVALFTVGALTSPNAYDDAVIVAHDLESDRRQVLVEGGSMARFVAPDKLVYLRSGRLFVVSFDAEKLEVAGDPRPVVDGVAGDPSSGAAFFSVASNGTLAYVPGSSALFESYLVLVDRQGDPSRVPLSPRGFKAPRFSPDGSRIAFGVGEGLAGAQGNVWAYSLANGSLDRLTFADGMNHYPVWSSDGSRLAFLQELTPSAVGSGEAGGIYALAADGSDDRELLVPFGRAPLMPGDWSPDGRTLAYNSVGLSDVFLLDLEGGSSTLFESNASAPTFSPNGRWLAYQSPAAGNASVFVRSVEGPGKWQVSPGQGAYPRWSRDGRELFYIDSSKPERSLMVVDVAEDDAFRAGPSRTLLPDLSRFTTATAPSVNWDVAPDGRSFVFVELARDEVERSRIEVVVDWASGLDVDGS